MKILYVLLAGIFFSLNIFAQDGSTFFPANTGFTWTIKEIPLDSLNNEIDSLSFYRIDSFAVVQNYKGKNANVIFSKEGSEENIISAPFIDTNYVNFEGTNANFYFELFNIDSVLNSSSVQDLNSPLRKITEPNFEGWYPFYRFAEPENQSYLIFSIDSSLTFDSLQLNIIFMANGIRLSDENVQTEIGDFNSKKFVINNTVFLLLDPFPPIKIFTISDTVWIAPGNWIVKEIVPSNTVDLSIAGAGSINIPGYKRTVTAPIVTSIASDAVRLSGFRLFQNYPNPFNPSTIIRYTLNRTSNVKLKIYNILGNEVAELVNKEQPEGEYKINFNPSEIGGLSSGIYFYSLQAGSKSLTKKLIYLK